MTAGDFYYLMLLFFMGGSAAALLTRRSSRLTNYIAHSMALVGCIMAVLCAIFVFMQGKTIVPLPLYLPWGTVVAQLDSLAAFFLLMTGVAGGTVSLYAYGYCREYYQCRLPLMAGLYNAFLLSMTLVFTVSHVAGFIIAWELMSLVSFFLVNHEYEKWFNNRSAYIYLVMTHVGTAFIIMAFLLLSSAAGSMEFARLSQAPLNETARNFVFLGVIAGFGTKAGIIPVHIWLPRAHPAAPSHISALMSGLMLKTAIYGMLRFFLEFLPAGPWWWGVTVLVLAAVTALIGVLYAFIEHDLKRLLAYSSIENIGIVLLGVGAALVFISAGMPAAAGIAVAAALFHSFNHALFKSLSFMGAGAVLQVTHTKNIEQLGGLIKKMPWTAVFCLVGSTAIAALPPFNGFVSEWLVFQVLLLLPQALGGIGGKLFSALLIAALGLTGALAAACFAEAFGITFLAKPRSRQAEEAVESPRAVLWAMGILAALCAVLGIWPQLMLTVLKQVLQDFSLVNASGFTGVEWYRLGFAAGSGQGGLSTADMLLLLLLGAAIAWLLYRLRGSARSKTGETWTCGIVPDWHMEYTATGFSKSIRMVFKSIVHAHAEQLVNSSRYKYHGQKLAYEVRIRYVFISKVYQPLNSLILRGANVMRRIQTGSVQLYVGYIMAVTVAILIWSTRW